MNKSEIFAKILERVSMETEVPVNLILSQAKAMEVVDARAITAYLLSEYGLYPGQIAVLLRKTPASVRYLLSAFDSRKNVNKMITIYLQNIRKSLENKP